MDHQALVLVAASTREALSAFAAAESNPTASLTALARQIDQAFDAACSKLAGPEREIADEVRAVLLDQIAIMQRQTSEAGGGAV